MERRKVVDAEFIIDGYLIKCDKRICKSHGKIDFIIISYDLDGGIAEKETDAIERGKTVELPSPTKEGHTFNGWYDEDNHEVTNETTFNKDTTIYARYTVNKYTITLENAKFSDNTTSKQINYGEEVQIAAIIPTGTIEPNYVGETSCSSVSDIGNIKYRINHGYAVESWNVTDSTENTITYRVPAEDKTVIATIKEAELMADKRECYSYSASYSSGYYSCPSGGTLSSTTCTVTTTTTYDASVSYSCPSGYSRSGTTCKKCSSSSYECHGDRWCGTVCNSYSTKTATKKYSCNSGDTIDGSTCTKTTVSTYNAPYTSGYYYCSGSGYRSGTTCYNTRSVN